MQRMEIWRSTITGPKEASGVWLWVVPTGCFSGAIPVETRRPCYAASWPRVSEYTWIPSPGLTTSSRAFQLIRLIASLNSSLTTGIPLTLNKPGLSLLAIDSVAGDSRTLTTIHSGADAQPHTVDQDEFQSCLRRNRFPH